MPLFRRLRSLALRLARALVVLLAIALSLAGIAIATVESGWGKNQIRALIVRQANQYLTARLDIGRLEGSLFRGIELGDITLTRDGHTIIAIDSAALSYNIRELWQQGVVVGRIRLTRPRIVAAKQPDGLWNLAALVKREVRQEERSGPARPIEIQAIEVVDASISLRDQLDFGAAHLPTEFTSLNARMSFAYEAVKWTLTLGAVSWVGRAPDLDITRLSGKLGHGPGGWFVDDLTVQTPRSAFTMNGGVLRDDRPTELDLEVHARPFAFQEWSGVLRGLKNIAVEAAFDARLKGPLTRLDTNIRLTGTGGDVNGRLTLDTTVPGWHGTGTVEIARLNLARWLNRSDRPSDVTGRVSFDLDLDLGRHFPRGSYTFDGAHAMFMDYAADNVHARGRLTSTAALVAAATSFAYGADVTTTAGSIGIDDPFPFRFLGTIAGLDLRRVPTTVPVPHVESTLAFDYEVSGRFAKAYVIGRAQFNDSQFLGATIGRGTVGTFDSSVRPLGYSGDGELDGVNLSRFGEGLDIAWMRDPRYAGTVSARFRVAGSGTDRASLTLTASGRLARANLFRGTVSDADIGLEIEGGTLRTTFAGAFDAIDPAIPFADPRFAASLTGSATGSATIRDLLTRTPTLADYDINGRATLQHSTARDVAIDRATVNGSLVNARLRLDQVEVAGPAISGNGSGAIALTPGEAFDFRYDVTRADLSALQPLARQSITGILATSGRLTGPESRLHAVGNATVNELSVVGFNALTLGGMYDLTSRWQDMANAMGHIEGRGSFLKIFGETVEQASGTISLASNKLGFDVTLIQGQRLQVRRGQLAGSALLHTDRRAVDLLDLTVNLGSTPWRLARGNTTPLVSWSDAGFALTPLVFVSGPTGEEQIGLSGTWRRDGKGALRVTATHVFLETLEGAFERPARYGGIVDLDVTIRGTRDQPFASGMLTVTNGRVERVTYQKLAGRVDYAEGMFDLDVRLDQSPGVWLTATGQVPLAVLNRDLPERSINVAIHSSSIDLGLLEGVTDLVRNVSGRLLMNLTAVGTSRDPHFDGTIEVADAAFLVTATGSKYGKGRAMLRLSPERITVESLHLDDEHNHSLDVSGSLGTHELQVSDLVIDAKAGRFEVIHNELGRVDVDADLRLRGRFEAPRVTGEITVNGDLKVDGILERTLFQPYATEPTIMTPIDAVVRLNPWSRLGMDLTVRVPRTFRLTGTNVQVTPGTPIGLGDINLRAGGDLYVYKDPGGPTYITGSLYTLSGTYAFQGRRFDIDETSSSINFQGDLNPEIYIVVTRDISSVRTRITVNGPLRQPELHLASTPPLDPSDILSLIVFNAPPNQLSGAQQRELAVRAGALAAGFLATPLLTAIQNELGISAFEIEPAGTFGAGPRVTIGEELAPGLVARFSRQFGPEAFDEATVEFYLSRLLRLRATFSDAQSLTARSPFRRIERAGIDLLVFLSF